MTLFKVTFYNSLDGAVRTMIRPGKSYNAVEHYCKGNSDMFETFTITELPEAIWTQYGPAQIIGNCHQANNLCYYGTIEDMDLYMDYEGNLYGIYF